MEVANGAELAAAIVQANSDASVTRILCATKNGCDVVGTLPTYTGSQNLVIDGRFSTIDATGITDQDAFASTGGGLLKLIRLTFVGGMSGVYVEVPADQTGTQRVDFRKVTIRDTSLHGALVSDGGNSYSKPAGCGLPQHLPRKRPEGDDDQDGLHIFETGGGERDQRCHRIELLCAMAPTAWKSMRMAAASVTLTIDDAASSARTVLNPTNPSDPEDGLDIDESANGRCLGDHHRQPFQPQPTTTASIWTSVAAAASSSASTMSRPPRTSTRA